MQPSVICIGLSENCSAKCSVSSIQQLNKSPHKDKHNFIGLIQLPIVLKDCHILSVGKTIRKYQQIIHNVTQKIKTKIDQHSKQLIKSVHQILFRSLISPNVVLDDNLIKTYLKIISLQFDDLTCQQVNKSFSSIANSFKPQQNEIKVKADVQIYTQKLIKIEQLLINQRRDAQSYKIPSFFTNQQYSTGSSKTKREKEEISASSENNESKQSKMLSFLDETSFKISQNDNSSLKSSEISIQFKSKIQMAINQNNQSNINSKMKQMRIEQSREQSREYQYYNLHTYNHSNNQQEQQFEDEQEKEKEEQSDQYEQEYQQQKQDQSGFFVQNRRHNQYIFTKKQGNLFARLPKPLHAVVSQSSPRQQQFILQSLMTYTHQQPVIKKSYKRKNIKPNYITIQNLQKDQRYRQKPKQNKFNIKLRVHKIIIFKFQKNYIQQQNSLLTNLQINAKVKFIGGDQSGIIVCYTNYIPQIKQGNYVVIKQCQLKLYQKFSYQIVSNNCEALKQQEIFFVKVKQGLSKFLKFDNLLYDLQYHNAKWPSIIGLSRWNFIQNESFSLIAQLHQIIKQSSRHIQCYLSDGTGKIEAIIQKQDNVEFIVGKSYYFKRMYIKITAQSHLKLVITQENKPKCLKNMVYGNRNNLELIQNFGEFI